MPITTEEFAAIRTEQERRRAACVYVDKRIDALLDEVERLRAEAAEYHASISAVADEVEHAFSGLTTADVWIRIRRAILIMAGRQP